MMPDCARKATADEHKRLFLVLPERSKLFHLSRLLLFEKPPRFAVFRWKNLTPFSAHIVDGDPTEQE